MSERRILLVDDEDDVRLPLRRFFEKSGYQVAEAASVADAEQAFRSARPDVALLDYSLPDGDGLELLRRLKNLDGSVPAVILTAHGSIEIAVSAIKEGAEQFFTKPVELPAVLVVVERLLENQRLRQVTEAGRSRRSRNAVDPFLGESRAMRRLAEQAAKVARATTPVLILGETGSGKGVLARWLHESSARADQAFVDLNCAGLSRELLETELFGHQRGAFTGAVAAKTGLMETAHRGTLFLDEIGDVDLSVQAKLLKVLEDMRFRRLGDVHDRQVDVRLIAATHRDLGRLVQEEKFREDLYYRIRGIPLTVPPLRERGKDVVSLARLLVDRIAHDMGRPGVRLSAGAEAALLAHAWPGNVRELRNVLEHAVLLSNRPLLEAADLPEGPAPRAASSAPAGGGSLSLEDVERRHIEKVLKEEKGGVQRAAKLLGISRSALYERIRKYGIVLERAAR
jgi:DNA-binding NtrC family response regulator